MSLKEPFWRFLVEYRALFGESPSVTLNHRSEGSRRKAHRDWPASDSA